MTNNSVDGRLDSTGRYLGLLLGGLTGDCLGLPFEMLSPGQKRRIFGEDIEHKFFNSPFTGRKGVCSDDTEHLWLTAVTLCKAGRGNLDDFGRNLSMRLKYWILTLPVGIGKATLLSCLKLLAGFNYNKSGVNSAGNGAAIRAVIIGVFYSDDLDLMAKTIKVSTLMTHSDPKAYEGSLAIGLAAATAMGSNSETHDLPSVFFEVLLPLGSVVKRL